MKQIRQIQPFGPAVGEYVSSTATDIRNTFDRERNRLARERVQQLVRDVEDQQEPDDDVDALLELARAQHASYAERMRHPGLPPTSLDGAVFA